MKRWPISLIFFLVWNRLYAIYLFLKLINLLISFGCVGSSLLHAGFLQLRWAGATLWCGAQASHCSGFSCCRARALGMRASVIVAHGLNCYKACGIFPDQGSNPCPLHWQVDSFFFFLIYFWLCWVFVAVRGLLLVAVSGGYSSLQCMGFSLWWLLLWSTGSRRAGFSICGTWAQYLWLAGSRAQAQ